MPYECAESSHAVEHRSRATCASGTPTLMLVTAIMPLLAAHRFFLVSVHASAAKSTSTRRCATRRGCLDGWYGVTCSPTTVRQESRICRLSRPQKRRIRSLRNKRSACGRPLVAQRSTGQQKSAALARRRGARHIDARPGFPAGHRRRRGAGGLSDTVVQRTVHANGVAPVWPGGVASIASRVVASRYTPLLIWLSDAWSRR